VFRPKGVFKLTKESKMKKRSPKPFTVSGFNIVSPKGKALWCKIKEPDRMFNPLGEYSTSLVCDPDDPKVQAFIENLESLRDTALEETKQTLGPKARGYKPFPVYSEEFDQDDNPTGNIVFKFKLKDVDARKEKGLPAEVEVVDAKKHKISPVPLVGNGSIIRCLAFASPYSMPSTKTVGVTLIWKKLQILELVEYESSVDFDEEEDGFTADSSPVSDDFDDDDVPF